MTIEMDSIEFHCQRGKWLEETLKYCMDQMEAYDIIRVNIRLPLCPFENKIHRRFVIEIFDVICYPIRIGAKCIFRTALIGSFEPAIQRDSLDMLSGLKIRRRQIIK